MPPRALVNARRAAHLLALSNAERAALAPREGDAGEPGSLRRLPRQECIELLATRRVGRFAHVVNARALDIVPVNYVSRPDGSILFRSGPGPKLSAADRRDVVAFQVDAIDEERMTGWSVLVTGRARKLRDEELSDAGDLPHPWATGPRNHVVIIQPSRIEGRELV